MHHKGNQEHTEGCSYHSQRNKARLDKVPGITGRKDGTHHQAADGKRQVILDHIHRRRTGHVLEHQRKHLGHSPEHRKGDNGGAQGTLAPTQAKPATGRSKFHILIGVLDFGDQETGHSTQDAHPHQNPGNHHGLGDNLAHSLVLGKAPQFNQVHAHDGKPAGRNDTAQGENLQESVGIAQVANAKHFLQYSILGRTVNCKTRRKTDAQPERHSGNTTGHQHRHGNNKGRHKQRRPCQHPILGKLVGEEPRRPHEHHVGSDKEDLQHKTLPVLATGHPGKGTGQNLLGVNEHTHLNKRYRKDRKKETDCSSIFPHFGPTKNFEVKIAF